MSTIFNSVFQDYSLGKLKFFALCILSQPFQVKHEFFSSSFNNGFGSGAHVNEGRQESEQDSKSWQHHGEKLVLVLHKLLFPFTFFTGIFFDFSFELPHLPHLFFHVSQTYLSLKSFDVYKHQVDSAVVVLFGDFSFCLARWR